MLDLSHDTFLASTHCKFFPCHHYTSVSHFNVQEKQLSHDHFYDCHSPSVNPLIRACFNDHGNDSFSHDHFLSLCDEPCGAKIPTFCQYLFHMISSLINYLGTVATSKKVRDAKRGREHKNQPNDASTMKRQGEQGNDK